MKIDDVSKIYDFLGNIDILGFISLCVLLSITILIIISPFKEGNNVPIKLTVILIVLVNLSLIAVYIDARNNTENLQLANLVKQDFISKNFKQQRLDYIHVLDNKDGDKVKILLNLTKKFPDEFSLIYLTVSNYNGSLGKSAAISLVDPKALEIIDKQLKDKSNQTAHLLATLINSHKKIDTILMDNPQFVNKGLATLQNIDNDAWLIGQSFYKTLVGKNDLLPIYDQNFRIIGFTIPKTNVNLLGQ